MARPKAATTVAEAPPPAPVVVTETIQRTQCPECKKFLLSGNYDRHKCPVVKAREDKIRLKQYLQQIAIDHEKHRVDRINREQLEAARIAERQKKDEEDARRFEETQNVTIERLCDFGSQTSRRELVEMILYQNTRFDQLILQVETLEEKLNSVDETTNDCKVKISDLRYDYDCSGGGGS